MVREVTLVMGRDSKQTNKQTNKQEVYYRSCSVTMIKQGRECRKISAIVDSSDESRQGRGRESSASGNSRDSSDRSDG